MGASERRQNKKRHKNIGKNIVSICVCLLYLLPLYVLLNMAFKVPTDHSSRLSLPAYFDVSNFLSALDGGGFLRAMMNTVIVTAGVVLILVVVGCMAAYPLSRDHTRITQITNSLCLGVMMIPALSILVGVYTEIVSLGGVNHLWAVIAVQGAFGLPMSIFMYKNFIRSIPESLDEAAVLDGANSFQVFWNVILPQLRPVTVSIIICDGAAAWNTYMYPSYILQRPQKFTLVLLVRKYFNSGSGAQNLHGAAAAAVLCVLPLVLLYLFLQKYFIKGQLDSAVK